LDVQPIRRTGNPLFHNGRRTFLAEFTDDCGRDQDSAVEIGQDVAVLDENQISERTGVSDDDH
jgi:hypothetical protein